MRTVTRLLIAGLLAAPLGACSGEGPRIDTVGGAQAAADGAQARPATVGTADGVLKSYDAATGTAIVTDWAGQDHEVGGEGLADATYVTLTDGSGATSPDPAPLEAVEDGGAGLPGQGAVKWFNNDKGYGFITRDLHGEDVFVHHSEIQKEGFRTLVPGQRVEFDLRAGPGSVELVATNVVIVG